MLPADVLRRLLPLGFVLIALPTATMMALLVPVGRVPDEPAHIARAAGLLDGQILAHRQQAAAGDPRDQPQAGVRVDPALLQAAFALATGPAEPGPAMTRAEWERARNIRWSAERVFVPIANTGIYFPALYAPAAAGLAVAKALGIQPYGAILAARLSASITYVVLGALALLLAPFGAPLLLASLLLPMSLFLAGSANIDAILIAAYALAVACIAYGIRAPETRAPAHPAASVLVACVTLTKLPYLPLAAILLLPCTADGRLRWRIAAAAAVALASVAWAAAMQAWVAVPLLPGLDPRAQVRVIEAQPGLLLSLPLAGMHEQGELLLRQLVGVLGWLNRPLPGSLYAVWYWSLAAAAFGSAFTGRGKPQAGWRPGDTALLLAAAVGFAFCVFCAQYLTWTPTGAARIEGVQGRYFIPLLSMSALAVPRMQVPAGRALSSAFALPAIAAGALGFAILLQSVVFTDYLR